MSLLNGFVERPGSDVIRPIELSSELVNQSAPSGPVVIPLGPVIGPTLADWVMTPVGLFGHPEDLMALGAMLYGLIAALEAQHRGTETTHSPASLL